MERIIHNFRTTDCIVVGSSLSAGLRFPDEEKLPGQQRILNLSLAGGSALTGLRLIDSADLKPACVIVEANLAYKPADERQIKKMMHPVKRFVIRFFPSMRHENQPLNMFLTLLRSFRQKKKKDVELSASSIIKKTTKTEQVEKAIAGYVSSIAKISTTAIASGADSMMNLAIKFATDGTRILFVLIPGESKVMDSVYYTNVSSAWDNEFAKIPKTLKPMINIHPLTLGSITTTDGIHLAEHHGQAVAHQLQALTSAP